MRSVPACLARLAVIDLSDARGRPTALARLVFVLLLLHASGEPPLAWPGVKRLADLTGSSHASVHKALALLCDRGVIEQTRSPPANVWRAWRILLPHTRDGELTRVRVFWPQPFGEPRGGELTAFKALVRGLGNRNHAAIAIMVYQFARQHEGAEPSPPNQAWIGRVLDTDQSTVSRAKREIIARGLATIDACGRLVFEDPARWPKILNVVEPSPSEPAGEPLALVSLREAANGNAYRPAANGNAYTIALETPEQAANNNLVATADVEQTLAVTGWALPADPTAHEIVAAAVETWGPAATLDRLRAELAGPHPSYALESLGAELGEQFECPYQLIRRG